MSRSKKPTVDQRTLRGVDDDEWRTIRNPVNGNPKYEVSISSRGIKWSNLSDYLGIIFPGVEFPKDLKPALNGNYVLNLPAKLSIDQQQDIEFLKREQDDIDEFLQELRKEMPVNVSELQTVDEEMDDDTPRSPTGNRMRQRGKK